MALQVVTKLAAQILEHRVAHARIADQPGIAQREPTILGTTRTEAGEWYPRESMSGPTTAFSCWRRNTEDPDAQKKRGALTPNSKSNAV